MSVYTESLPNVRKTTLRSSPIRNCSQFFTSGVPRLDNGVFYAIREMSFLLGSKIRRIIDCVRAPGGDNNQSSFTPWFPALPHSSPSRSRDSDPSALSSLHTATTHVLLGRKFQRKKKKPNRG